jgi:hypothetical protein
MRLSYGIFIIPLTSIVRHVSSVMSLILRNLNCIRAAGLRTLLETARGAVWVETGMGIVPGVTAQVY